MRPRLLRNCTSVSRWREYPRNFRFRAMSFPHGVKKIMYTNIYVHTHAPARMDAFFPLLNKTYTLARVKLVGSCCKSCSFLYRVIPGWFCSTALYRSDRQNKLWKLCSTHGGRWVRTAGRNCAAFFHLQKKLASLQGTGIVLREPVLLLMFVWQKLQITVAS